MNRTTLAVEMPTGDAPLLLNLGAIYHQFQTLADGRKRRGVRYPLAVLLTIAVLGKLAGYSQVAAIADWARARADTLVDLFDLARRSMPHEATWSRVFGQAVAISALEQAVATLSAAPSTAEVPARGSLIANLDGKTLRGTIPLGQTTGVHLLAAYQADDGRVLAQAAVGTKTNEIGAAPALLQQVDLTGVVVTGDAMHAQRDLSTQVVQAGGDYFWWVKQNQPALLADLELLFADEYVSAGWSAPSVDFTTAQSVDKGHGRIEVRELTASSMLQDYVDWPYLAQVVRVSRTRLTKLKTAHEVSYAITSLPATTAATPRLLAIGRAHWRIENGLHYRRDVTLHEDASMVRVGQAPQVLAALNNLVCGLCARAKMSNLAAFQRFVARQIDQWMDVGHMPHGHPPTRSDVGVIPHRC
jgi:predicted transposase YbfD/YdcC